MTDQHNTQAALRERNALLREVTNIAEAGFYMPQAWHERVKQLDLSDEAQPATPPSAEAVCELVADFSGPSVEYRIGKLYPGIEALEHGTHTLFAAQSPSAERGGDAVKALMEKITEYGRVSDACGRSRGSNNYAMNEAAVQRFVDLQEEIRRELAALASQPAAQQGWDELNDRVAAEIARGHARNCGTVERAAYKYLQNVDSGWKPHQWVLRALKDAYRRGRNDARASLPAQQATTAGLEAANGHITTLLNECAPMLAELRALVDGMHDQWCNGGRPERGEVPLLDRVDDWLAGRPPQPVQQAIPEHVKRAWLDEMLSEPAMNQFRAELRAARDEVIAAQQAREPMTAVQQRQTDIGAAIERAASGLPDCYEIDVCVERGAAWVTVTCPEAENIAPTLDGDHTLAEQVDICLEAAIRHATPQAGQGGEGA